MQKIVDAQNAKERLDTFLVKETDLTRSYIAKLIKEKHITLNGNEINKCGQSLRVGDVIQIELPQTTYNIEPENIPLDIIYQDNDIAVINKQAGISVHPSGKIVNNTLVNALMYHIKDLSGINGVNRPGIIHRLDKDTTGIIIIAKNDAAHLSLSKQFAARTVKKIYHALLEGVIKESGGTIDTLINRSRNNRKQMAVTKSADGRKAISTYSVIKRYREFTYAQFDIKTGRTHQIRVHAKFINHPVAGDKTYGHKKQKLNLDGQLLHAYSITFKHPRTNVEMTLTAELPQIFKEILMLMEENES